MGNPLSILLAIVVLLLLFSLPVWPYMSPLGWGYYPSGGLLLILVVLLVVVLVGGGPRGRLS